MQRSILGFSEGVLPLGTNLACLPLISATYNPIWCYSGLVYIDQSWLEFFLEHAIVSPYTSCPLLWVDIAIDLPFK